MRRYTNIYIFNIMYHSNLFKLNVLNVQLSIKIEILRLTQT
jgi:hypothetical protein